jgi:ribosomal protein S18 acetylase RimI-like enzyme
MAVILSDDITTVDWEQLAIVFERAPLGTRTPENLEQVFQNSDVRCFAREGSMVVGAGRAITDWLNYAVIFDVVLLPEYQGQGIGTQIMKYLAEHARARNVLLHAVPGKEMFYQKLGYRKLKTGMGLFEDPEKQQRLGYIE